MSDDLLDGDPSFRTLITELPVAWAVMMVDEWNNRTRFGKLLYPLWFANSAIQWIGLLGFMASIAILAPFMRGLSKPSPKIPGVYKEDND